MYVYIERYRQTGIAIKKIDRYIYKIFGVLFVCVLTCYGTWMEFRENFFRFKSFHLAPRISLSTDILWTPDSLSYELSGSSPFSASHVIRRMVGLQMYTTASGFVM